MADCPLEDSEVIAQLQFEQDAAGRPFIIVSNQTHNGYNEADSRREHRGNAGAARREEQPRLQKKWCNPPAFSLHLLAVKAESQHLLLQLASR